MAKSTSEINNPEVEQALDFDFDDENYEDFTDYERDQAAADVMQGMIETARFEAEIALGLTKLVLKTGSNKEVVFALYREALTVAAETSPVKKMLERMQEE